MNWQVIWLLGLTSNFRTQSTWNYSLLATLARPVFHTCPLSIGDDSTPLQSRPNAVAFHLWNILSFKKSLNKEGEQKLHSTIHHSGITLLSVDGFPSRLFYHGQPHTIHFLVSFFPNNCSKKVLKKFGHMHLPEPLFSPSIKWREYS